MQKSIKLLLILLFLSACMPSPIRPESTPIPTVLQPTLARPTATVLPPTATQISIPPTPTIDDLIRIIYISDPSLPQYDPDSTAFAQFPDVIKQIGNMGGKAIDLAGDLAVAIRFPRQDSYLAAQALLNLGPDITATTIVSLMYNLHTEKPDARIYSVILLGSAENTASCAVGDIGPLLWDPDPVVRSATALALEKITAQDLAASEYEVSITPSFLANSIPADTPEGKVVSAARQWWVEQGSKVNWHPSYGICDP